ncbi:hypothetical protein KIPB_014815, partial [Kipferlia bialata]
GTLLAVCGTVGDKERERDKEREKEANRRPNPEEEGSGIVMLVDALTLRVLATQRTLQTVHQVAWDPT